MAITFEVDQVAPAQHLPATEAWGDVAAPHLASGLPAEPSLVEILQHVIDRGALPEGAPWQP